jgi:hypothetical protein
MEWGGGFGSSFKLACLCILMRLVGMFWDIIDGHEYGAFP